MALADYDPQRSSLDWLERRPADRAEIHPVAAFQDGLRYAPRSADVIVSDAPARSHGPELTNLVKHAETIIVLHGGFGLSDISNWRRCFIVLW